MLRSGFWLFLCLVVCVAGRGPDVVSEHDERCMFWLVFAMHWDRGAVPLNCKKIMGSYAAAEAIGLGPTTENICAAYHTLILKVFLS
jgi:hypothetical protein